MMTREDLESLADRAAEDGEHSVVGACQVLLRRDSSDEDREEAETQVREYAEQIRGW
jgi:hypothetical protein